MDSMLLTPLPVADVFYAFRESTLAGKAIVALLFAGSILAWSIMVTKGMDLSRAMRESARFLDLFRKESHPVSLYVKKKVFANSPLFTIYEMGCLAIGRELERGEFPDRDELLHHGMGAPVGQLSRLQMEAIRNLAERNVASQALQMENNMGVLATAVTSAPFLGLLGTVWGVMDGFAGMAEQGSANLSAVAPGISAALLTTVVGLLVALPSAIGYNLLTNKIRVLTVQMDNFAQEFDSEVRRVYFKD